MKKQILRSPTYVTLEKYSPSPKGAKRQITHKREEAEHQRKMLLAGVPLARLQQIEKYLRNAERGCLPMSNDGADVTRLITAEQIAKFLECKVCQAKPWVYIPCNKNCLVSLAKPLRALVQNCVIPVCQKHWIDLATTVIGWSGGPDNEKCPSLDVDVEVAEVEM